MNEKDITKLVEAYIEIYGNDEEFDEFHPQYWAIEKFTDLEADYPEVSWTAILEVVDRNPPQRVLANLAAGPLEELLELHGESYIERIEKEARANPVFRDTLRLVWEITNKAVWQRVLKATRDS
jgi:hypothetical protein